MFLGIVRGEIHATIQHGFYARRRLLIVDKLDECGAPAKGYIVAVAAVDAGVGDRVLILDEGNGARQIFRDAKAPVRSAVVGVVDAIETEL